jgi:hypothetical protein
MRVMIVKSAPEDIVRISTHYEGRRGWRRRICSAGSTPRRSAGCFGRPGRAGSRTGSICPPRWDRAARGCCPAVPTGQFRPGPAPGRSASPENGNEDIPPCSSPGLGFRPTGQQ